MKVGQRVHVEFDGLVTYDNGNNTFDVEIDGTDSTIEYLPAAMLKGNDWPPQIGDVWEANGKEFYVRENYVTSGKPVVEPFGSYDDMLFDHTELDMFKALNPSLVRRRDA